MKVFSPIALCMLISGMACCEEPEAVFEDRSLLDLLVAEKTIGYRHDSDTGTFTISLLSEAAKKRIHKHYDDGGAIAIRYNRLRREFDDLVRQSRSKLPRGSVDADERNQRTSQILATQRELSELQWPDGIDRGARQATAASLTRYGTDYLVVRELHSMREVLMPLERIAMVVDDAPIAEPPHATEPVIQRVSRGDVSLPAR